MAKKSPMQITETAASAPMYPKIWPAEYTGEDKSPIPILVVEGDSGTGKTTTLASIAPAPKGMPARTIVIDTEQSWSDIATHTSVVHYQIPTQKYRDQGHNLVMSRWLAFLEVKDRVIQEMKDGMHPEVKVLAIDSASDLRDGAQQWLVKNPQVFGRSHLYKDKLGVSHSWVDTNTLFESILVDEFGPLFETVAVAIHRKKDFKTSTMREDGFKLVRKVALHLILFGTQHVEEAKKAKLESACRWAWVIKQRLSYQYIDEDGELRVAEMLPRKLIATKDGTSYIAMIRKFMRNPQANYGDLSEFDDEAGIDEKPNDEQFQKEYELKLREAKREMADRLKAEGLVKDDMQIANLLREMHPDEDGKPQGFKIESLTDVDTAETLIREKLANIQS